MPAVAPPVKGPQCTAPCWPLQGSICPPLRVTRRVPQLCVSDSAPQHCYLRGLCGACLGPRQHRDLQRHARGHGREARRQKLYSSEICSRFVLKSPILRLCLHFRECIRRSFKVHTASQHRSAVASQHRNSVVTAHSTRQRPCSPNAAIRMHQTKHIM